MASFQKVKETGELGKTVKSIRQDARNLFEAVMQDEGPKFGSLPRLDRRLNLIASGAAPKTGNETLHAILDRV